MSYFTNSVEAEVTKLGGDIESFPNPKWDELINKNSKAIYRLNHLNNVCKSNTERVQDKVMPNTLLALKYIFWSVIKTMEYISNSNTTPNLSGVKKESEYDYQYSDVMRLAKSIKMPEPVTSMELADRILKQIKKYNLIDKMEISKPGFINFSLTQEYVSTFCSNIIKNGVSPPGVKRRKVIMDMSSPNIAKEMHVGHLRSTILGDVIARILEFVGFEVQRLSHVGDWGTQFGMLIAHLEDCYPNFRSEVPPIQDLQKFYKESKKRFDLDETFKKRSQLKVTELQSGKYPDVHKAWEQICEISRKDFLKIYNRLDVSVIERGESFYQSRMVTLTKELIGEKKVKFEDGCYVGFIPGVKVPLMVVKSDGGFTYDTSDLATLKQRLDEEKADWILYIVDSGQRDHLETVFKYGALNNWFNPEITRVEHIGFGVVLGNDKKKFKTRSGELIKLSELLDEGVSRAMAKLKFRGCEERFNKEELLNIAEALAYSCIRYADLSRNLVSDYEFSFDKMLEDKGNTAVYLLYTYTRLRSVIRKSKQTDEQIVEYVKKNDIKFDHSMELKLMKKLVHFPEVVYRIVFDTYPHYLCDYVYDLCCTVTEYYDTCSILGNESVGLNMNRLAQVYAVASVMKKCFELLGLKPLEAM